MERITKRHKQKGGFRIERYGELFRHYGLLDAIELPTVLPERRHIYNQYSVRVKAHKRDEVLQSLRDQNIGATIYYPTSLPLQKCFQYLGHAEGDFPESEAATRELIALPIFPELTDEQQETVVRGVAQALDRLPSDRSTTTTIRPKFLHHSGKKAA